MRNFEIKNLQINFNQAEYALTIPVESRHDYKYGSATQSGRSMIEMLGVLAIIGVLSVGGIAGYSKAMMKYRINKTIEQITLIAGNIRTFFASQGNYRDLNDSGSQSVPNYKVWQKAKLVPDEMMVLTNGNLSGLMNVWGENVEISYVGRQSDSDAKAFYLRYSGISAEACIELVTRDWSSSDINLIEVMTWNDSAENWRYKKTPVGVDDATNICEDDSYNTSITFYFDVDTNSTYWQQYLN